MRQSLDQLIARPHRTYDQACKDTGYNPTMFNCCTGWRLPDPSIYKVFDVRACYDEGGYTASIVDPEEAHLAEFWTVYGARDASWTEWEAITDVSTEKLAKNIANMLHWKSGHMRGAPVLYLSTAGGRQTDLYQLWKDAVDEAQSDQRFNRITPYTGPTDIVIIEEPDP